jgi:hypothetical protein
MIHFTVAPGAQDYWLEFNEHLESSMAGLNQWR